MRWEKYKSGATTPIQFSAVRGARPALACRGQQRTSACLELLLYDFAHFIRHRRPHEERGRDLYYHNVFGEEVSGARYREMLKVAENRRELIAAGVTSRRDLFKMDC